MPFLKRGRRMTILQISKIREMRLKGKGYRAIASAVGLSRDIVRNYCKNHGLDGYAPVLSINVKEKMDNGTACLRCGKKIEQPSTGRKRKFCSDKCRYAWWVSHKDEKKHKETAIYKATCKHCGAVFTAYGNHHRKYCCHECYVQDRFKEETTA